MRAIRFVLCAILVTLTLVGCQTAEQPVQTDPTGAMKGYELYSWQDGGSWRFSILVGTNREKTLGEIQSPGEALDGIDALQAALERIPSGQFVTWSSGTGLAFPPSEIVERVQQVCRDRGLQLQVAR
jgi:hypothetical protein